MREWYHIDAKGHPQGPMIEREIKLLHAQGKIHPKKTLVWREGLEGWIPFVESELNHFPEPPAEMVVEEEFELGPAYVPEEIHYSAPMILGGRGRAWVWFGPVIAGAAAGALFFAGIKLIDPDLISEGGETKWAGWALIINSFLLFFIIPLYLRLRRLRNLGMKPWFILLELVPLANLWLWWRCFCCPEGYAITKKMDWIGWLLSCVFVTLLFVTSVLAWFWTTPI